MRRVSTFEAPQVRMTKHAAHSFEQSLEDPTDSDTDAAPGEALVGGPPRNPSKRPRRTILRPTS